MSDGKIGLFGDDMQPLQTITQFTIPAGAGATFAVANNIATLTFNAAHGLTLTPATGVPPNNYIQFGGSTSGLTGTGVLVGNTFRILSIPSTTAITFYTTVTAATVTSLTGLPVFLAPFAASGQSSWAGGPSQTISTVVTPEPLALLAAQNVNYKLGANCAVQWNTDNTFMPLDSTTGNTPAVAPAFQTLLAASSSGQSWSPASSVILIANGSTATSYAQVIS